MLTRPTAAPAPTAANRSLAKTTCIGIVAAMLALTRNAHLNYWLALLCSLGATGALAAFIERGILRRLMRSPRLIVLVARGSSDNAALFGRYLLEITSGIPVSLSAPSVHTLYNAKLNLRREVQIVFKSAPFLCIKMIQAEALQRV